MIYQLKYQFFVLIFFSSDFCLFFVRIEKSEKMKYNEFVFCLQQCLHFLSKNMWGMLCELLKTNESNQEAIIKFMDSLLDGEYEANVLR